MVNLVIIKKIVCNSTISINCWEIHIAVWMFSKLQGPYSYEIFWQSNTREMKNKLAEKNIRPNIDGRDGPK